MQTLVVTALAIATQWTVRTSQGFDALCALNILSGDPYYAAQYAADTALFKQPRYADARLAAARLKLELKDQRGMIISAFLTLVFSGGPDSTLDAIIESAKSPEALRAALRTSPFWSDQSWDVFMHVRGDVLAALESMRRAGFPEDWRTSFGGDPSARADSVRTALARYDVTDEQRRLVGPSFRAHAIQVILLRFSRPHGIRIQGERFLTDIAYPLTIVLRNAAHEPLHGAVDTSVIRSLAVRLAADSLVRSIVSHHNPSFGYNSLPGYVEEDIVQSLEQVVSERLGFAAPAAARWRRADDGMHLLAAALYDLMRESGFASTGGTFSTWLDARIAAGDFVPGEIERRARRIVGDDAVVKWKAAR